MDSKTIRQTFFDFFKDKEHEIVASAPIVNKNDPTLMFTNAGMNQFKDYFLGNKEPKSPRVADTQKCLRVSGKHNDLEEVGIDSYHHTMFEMLGNWSFGNYFKKEAINWAWELLTEKYGLDPNRLYVSVFEGDKSEGLDPDTEAVDFWKKWVPEDRILYFDKKDNFWEMGDQGPCGPCSEIHIDLRSDEDRAKIDGATLVNQDDPLVIEIWNLVFIQYNRKANGTLENLPAKHVDTGMGFERLCMAVQNKTSNYDTDVFLPFINFIEKESDKKYTYSYDLKDKSDIAMRVVVDHTRAVAFTIGDGQLPSNTGAGYVVRRILRRAVRYYYSFLDIKEPFVYKLIPLLADFFGDVFPELKGQVDFISKVIQEEERSFLRTLAEGLKRFDQLENSNGIVAGQAAFELYDTYGFPIDLTRLIAEERGLKVDEPAFEIALEEQKNRGRADAKKEVSDWEQVKDGNVEFIGYDHHNNDSTHLLKYRTVKIKDKNQFQMVLDKTPFYPEGGGQVGDKGLLYFGEEKVQVLNTVKENDLIIHVVDKIPMELKVAIKAQINSKKRALTENNHTATHLMHAALREVLGDHVQQKGSLVNEKYFRFDFSHFQKMTKEEIAKVEHRVNEKIRENIALQEDRSIPIAQAKESGAIMLFGEKYGDEVRMITFDPDYSRELCGGCHVNATGVIGQFKIISEGAIAAGVRRIEALTSIAAEQFVNKEIEELTSIRSQFKNPKNVSQSVQSLLEENKELKKQIEQLLAKEAGNLKGDLVSKFENINGINFLSTEVSITDTKALKHLIAQLDHEVRNAFIVIGTHSNGKAQLMVSINKELAKKYDLNAGTIVKELAKDINGGGGGQPFFATAGGTKVEGLKTALANAKSFL